MKTRTALLIAAVLATTAAAAPIATTAVRAEAPSVTAAGEACLQNNRLWGWRVLNTRTVEVSDRTNKKFRIHLAGGCVGLNNAVQTLAITGDSSLSCVRRGNFVAYRAPAVGRISCPIVEVERVPTTPPKTPERAQSY